MKKLLMLLFFFVACAIPGREAFNSGVLAWEKEDYDRAIIDFETAIKQNSELGEAHEALAECYVRKQRLEEAQKAYARAKQIYDAGKFQDTNIPNEKKQIRVTEQLEWIEKALSLDSKTASQPTSAPQ